MFSKETLCHFMVFCKESSFIQVQLDLQCRLCLVYERMSLGLTSN